MQQEMVQGMLTTQGVIKRLGVARMTLYRWRKAGKLRYIEFPRRQYRYHPQDIEEIAKKGF